MTDAHASSPSLQFRLLGPGDDAVLERVAPDVFDHPVDRRWTAEFLGDPRHHLAVALCDGIVVGMASGVHYVHPDKPPELWINEVGVSPVFQRRGIARRLLATLFVRARQVGCTEAWVLTERSNDAAMRLYDAAGGSETEEETVMFAFYLGEKRSRGT
jgi:ribosomal protein S18 acetylase RimI-like enzyme